MGFSAYSVHGFRSTFRDWAGEATTFPEAGAEAALSHQVGSEVKPPTSGATCWRSAER